MTVEHMGMMQSGGVFIVLETKDMRATAVIVALFEISCRCILKEVVSPSMATPDDMFVISTLDKAATMVGAFTSPVHNITE